MFEFDPEKSAANKAKHGIDFNDVQALWDDRGRIELVSAQWHDGEDRSLVIGVEKSYLDGDHHVSRRRRPDRLDATRA